MKRKLTQEEFDALSDAIKALYKKNGDHYLLELEDDPADELRRAKEREAQARKDAEKELEAARKKLADIEGDDARKRGDIATLEKSWNEKLKKQEDDAAAIIAKYRARTEKSLISDVAAQLAAKLAPNAVKILLPHIRARLTVDHDADEPVTRVLDENGKLSALTVADLEKEFRTNADFAAIIVGSNASGSGATGNKGGGAPKKLSEMNDKERIELYRSNPDEFRRLKDAETA